MNRSTPSWVIATSVLTACTALVACGLERGRSGAGCVASLLPGDLVITEIMANPDGSDEGEEWFEIFNTSGATLNLEGLVLSYLSGAGDKRAHTVGQVTIPGNAYLVLGGIAHEFAPGYVDYGYGSDLGALGNGEGTLSLVCDVIEVDAVRYASMPSGTSMELSRAIFPDSGENDEWSNWCQGVSQYAAGNAGSPGAANECTGGSLDGTCLDADAMRPVVPPGIGDLVLTEFMPNPAAVGDTDGEWFEVKVAGDIDIDLNGVVFGRDPASGPDGVIDRPECWRVSAGAHILFARNTDPQANGGLPPVDVGYSFSLVNSGGSLFIGDGAGTVLDQVTWASSVSGASSNLDPGACDPRDNDDAANFCTTADAVYGDGDLGTPGATNQPCPVVVPPGFCTEPDSGALRPVVSPLPGDLTITEFMANPDGIGDSQGEWIEVRANATVDLNGLEVRKRTGGGSTDASSIDAVDCIVADAGTHHVLVRERATMANGCIEPSSGVFDVSLNNSDNTIYLSADGVDIDSVHYASVSAGSSSSLDEDTGQWCANQTDIYDTCLTGANSGTPGASNPACP